MFPSFFLALALPLFLATRINAESHTITFVNQCGLGYPALMYNGENILPNNSYVYNSNGPYSGIAYLQTGYCNVNGENCTLLEMTLINPTCAGCGSSTDISLIPPHSYSVETSFAYYDGCNAQGQTCNSANCAEAFFEPNDNYVQSACQVNDVNLLVVFCGNATQLLQTSLSNLIGGTPSVTAATSSPTTATSSIPPPPPPPPSSPTSSPPSSPASVPATTLGTTSTPSLSVSVSAGTPTLPPTSSPSQSSVPSISSPTSSTGTPTITPPITTSVPGVLNQSPTISDTGPSTPTGTVRRCHPRTSSNPLSSSPPTVAAASATATAVNTSPPKQCSAPNTANGTPSPSHMRHRRARHARMHPIH